MRASIKVKETIMQPVREIAAAEDMTVMDATGALLQFATEKYEAGEIQLEQAKVKENEKSTD